MKHPKTSDVSSPFLVNFRINAEVPDPFIQIDSGCIAYIDHNIYDSYGFACGPTGASLWVEDDYYSITVYSGFEGGENPPRTSKPRYMQDFKWMGYPVDVSISGKGCLHTVAKPGQKAQQIGDCAPREYRGDAITNPYWKLRDFLKRNPDLQLQRSTDSGKNPLTSTQIAFPEIESPSTQSAPDNLFLASAAFDQPLPLTDFTSNPVPEYLDDFNFKRRRKQRRDIISTKN